MTLTSEQAWRIAWTRGGTHLRQAVMHSGQLEAMEAFDKCSELIFVVMCTRRFGKSYMGVAELFAECIKTPNTVAKYAAPSQKDARSIVYPHAEELLSKCPADLRPKVNRSEMTWTWPNGSRMTLAGCDGDNADALRGTKMHIGFVDEGGFAKALRYVIDSVLIPQTITTGGRIIIASSPPVSPAHPLTAHYVPEAQAHDAFFRRTVYEVPHITREVADRYIARGGGPDSVNVRREWFAEVVIDSSMAIVPEFEKARAHIVCATDIPRWVDWYVSGDFGFSDLTVVLFAWYDFRRNKIVIEDEIATDGEGGMVVGGLVHDKERELGIRQPTRIADAPQQLLADLAHSTLGPGIAFGPAIKDDAQAALNQLRTEIQMRRIEINPRCKTLIAHLQYGVWLNDRKETFAREPGCGHFDAIDALKYLLRVVDRRRNPTPDILPESRREDLHIPPGAVKRRDFNAPARRHW